MTAEPFAICRLSDIPSRRAVGFHLVRLTPEGARAPWPIVVVRWGGRVFAYENHCPHGGGKLDWERSQFLDASGERLMCGKHGSTFDLATGEGLEGRCRDQSLTPIAVAVLDGDICILGQPLVEDEDAAHDE